MDMCSVSLVMSSTLHYAWISNRRILILIHRLESLALSRASKHGNKERDQLIATSKLVRMRYKVLSKVEITDRRMLETIDKART